MPSSMAITSAPRSAPTAAISASRPAVLVSFLAAHVVLGPILKAYPIIAYAHGIACLGGGVIYAATTRRVRNVAFVVAYVVGAEVLWRMTKAGVFWEFGKYTIVAVMLVALARMQSKRNRSLAMMYFGLLLPSALLTVIELPLEIARSELSFNLSGPLAIATSIVFFSNIRLNTTQLRDLFFALIAPVLAIASITLLRTASVELEFVNASNSATSGGFGPNQVAALLGLAAMMLLLISFDRTMRWRARVPLLALAAALATECALTFARGGLLLAFLGVAVALLLLIRGGTRMRLTVILVATIVVLLGKYVIEPQLDSLTGGKLSQRYTSTKTSGRDLFIDSELMMFSEHPLLGVGPGVGIYTRADRGLFEGASHTEYTRMLAEHGLLGIIAMCCLLLLCVRAIRDARAVQLRATACACLLWAAGFLGIYGIRVAAPALMFGVAFALRPPPPSSTASKRLAVSARHPQIA